MCSSLGLWRRHLALMTRLLISQQASGVCCTEEKEEEEGEEEEKEEEEEGEEEEEEEEGEEEEEEEEGVSGGFPLLCRSIYFPFVAVRLPLVPIRDKSFCPFPFLPFFANPTPFRLQPQ
ncbi:unnamed protein product [Arctogadus glacialis]